MAYIQLPNGKYLKIPEGMSPNEAYEAALIKFPNLLDEPQKKKGFGAALSQGLESQISSSRTGLASLVSPQEAAEKGLQRNREMADKYEEQVGFDLLKKAYEEKGLVGAGGELLRQVPLAVTQQAPNIAATLGGARLGAAAGSVFGPVGTGVGAIGGALVPSLLQQFGGNIERQAAEQQDSGKPLDISRTKALAAAIPQAGLDVAATFIPLGGKMAGKVFGPQVEKLLMRGNTEAAERLAKETLLPSIKKMELGTLGKGLAIGAAAEIPTEITQQMLERAQAGLDLTSKEALAEYGEAAYQAGLLAPIGGLGRVVDRSAAKGKIAAKEKEEEAVRAAEQAKIAEEEKLNKEAMDEMAKIAAENQPKFGYDEQQIESMRKDIVSQRNTFTNELDRLREQAQKESDLTKLTEITSRAKQLQDGLNTLSPAAIEKQIKEVDTQVKDLQKELKTAQKEKNDDRIAEINTTLQTLGDKSAELKAGLPAYQEVAKMPDAKVVKEQIAKKLVDIDKARESGDLESLGKLVAQVKALQGQYTGEQPSLFDTTKQGFAYPDAERRETAEARAFEETRPDMASAARRTEQEKRMDDTMDLLREGLPEPEKKAFEQIKLMPVGQLRSHMATLEAQKRELLKNNPELTKAVDEQVYLTTLDEQKKKLKPELTAEGKKLATIEDAILATQQRIDEEEFGKRIPSADKFPQSLYELPRGLPSVQYNRFADKVKGVKDSSLDELTQTLFNMSKGIEDDIANTPKLLNKKIEGLRGIVIRSALREASARRAAAGLEMLTTDDAIKVASRIDANLTELVNRIPALPRKQVIDALGVAIEPRLITRGRPNEQAYARRQKELEAVRAEIVKVNTRIKDILNTPNGKKAQERLAAAQTPEDVASAEKSVSRLPDMPFFAERKAQLEEREVILEKKLRRDITGEGITPFVEERLGKITIDPRDLSGRPLANLKRALDVIKEDIDEAIDTASTGRGKLQKVSPLDEGRLAQERDPIAGLNKLLPKTKEVQNLRTELSKAQNVAKPDADLIKDIKNQIIDKASNKRSAALYLEEIDALSKQDKEIYEKRTKQEDVDMERVAPSGVVPEQRELFGEKDLEPIATVRATPQNFMRFLDSAEVYKLRQKLGLLEKKADAAIEKTLTPTEALTAKIDKFRNSSKEYGAKLAELKADATEEAQAVASTLYAKKFYTEGLALAKQLYTGNIAKARTDLSIVQFELNDLEQRVKSLQSPRTRALMQKEIKEKQKDYKNAKMRLENLFGSFEATIDKYRETETAKLEEQYLNSSEFNNIKKLAAENAKRNKFVIGKFGFEKEAAAEKARAEVGKAEATQQKLLKEQVKTKRETEQVALEEREALPKTRQEIIKINKKVKAKRSVKFAPAKTQAEKSAEIAEKERELAEERKETRAQVGRGLTAEKLEERINALKEAIEINKEKNQLVAAKKKEGMLERLEKDYKSKMDIARMAMRGESAGSKPTPPRMETGVKPQTRKRKAKKDFEQDAIDHNVAFDDYMEVQSGIALGFKPRDEDAKTGEGLSKQDADASIAKVKLPKGLKLIVVNRLQGNLRDAVIEQGRNPDTVRGGVMPNGSVFIVAENHTDIKDLQRTLAHEITGHLGIENLLGESGMNALIKKITSQYGGVFELADKLGVKDDAIGAYAAAKRLGRTNEQALANAVREMIAHTEEARPDKNFLARAGEFIKAMVGAVRAALRKIGIDLDISTSDIYKLLRDARKDFNEITPGAYVNKDGDILFSNKPAVANDAFTGALKVTDGIIATQATFRNRVKAFFIGFETMYVDRFAPMLAVAKKMVDSLKATQMMYYLRMHDQRMAFTSEVASHGPLDIVPAKDGKGFVIRSIEGANLVNLVEALSKANVGNTEATKRVFTLWMVAQRAKTVGLNKLDFSGKITQQMLDEVERSVSADKQTAAAFKEASDIYAKYNEGLINFNVKAGAINKKDAEAMLKNKNFIPFYRQRPNTKEVFLEIGGAPAIKIGNLVDQPYLHELVGGDQPILDIFTSALQNTSMLVDMALRNMATKEVANSLSSLGMLKTDPDSKKDTGIHKGNGPQGPNVIHFKVDGENYFAEVDTKTTDIPTELLVKGLQGVNTSLPEIVKIMGEASSFLRKGITRNPAYALRQQIRDPLNAAFVAGVDTMPITSSMKEIANMWRGKSEGETLLRRSGILGGQTLTGTAEDMQKILNDLLSGNKGWDYRMAQLDKLAIQGDASTRVVMYNNYIKQGLSDMEATLATLESMNFSKRGISPSLFQLSIMVPFMNAQIQGLNVLYKAWTGNMPFNEKLNIKNKIRQRAVMMAGFTLIYASFMQDDEAYQNANDDEKYSNWFFPNPFGEEHIKVPIPFEVGLLFKAVPEALTNTIFGDAKAKDSMSAIAKMAWNNVPNFGPSAVKPIVEIATNYSFFTGRDIESARMVQYEPGLRYNERTSEIAKSIGGALNISPTKIEYLIRGYTGSLPLAIASMANPILRKDEGGEKPDTRSFIGSETPLIGTFFQPKDAGGLINKAYADMKDVITAKQSYNKLLEDGREREAQDYLDANADVMAMSSMAGKFRQQMGVLTKQERAIRSATGVSGKEKRDALDELRQAKIELAKEFSSVRE